MDNRTKRQKLEAMANQIASPQEAEIARKKLAAMKAEEPTPKAYIYVNGVKVGEASDFWFSFTFTNVKPSGL